MLTARMINPVRGYQNDKTSAATNTIIPEPQLAKIQKK